MKLNVKKLLKKVIILAFIVYFVVTVYKQQKTLNSYQNSIASVQEKIDEKTEYQESLISLRENASSLEYIEQIAREKLNMYKPSEKVYRDIGN